MFGTSVTRVAHAAELLVAIAGCAADPTGLTVTAAATTGVLSLKDIFRASTPEAKHLVRQITRDLDAALETPAFHMPAGAADLLPGLLEQALPAPQDIVGRNLSVDALLESMIARLPDTVRARYELVEAFCNWLRPSLTRLLGDPTFVQTLAPLIASETLTRLSELAEALVGLSATYGSLARSLDDLRNLHQSQLEGLALRFGLAPAPGEAPSRLIGQLAEKAADYRALTAELQAMRGLSDRLDNILGAVEDDIAALRFSEAKAKLETAREVQAEVLRKPLEVNAALMERQAQIALLEGQAERAFALFSDSASSFAALDPIQVARRRRTYAERLMDHGTRYGGPALSLAIRLLDRLLDDLPRNISPEDWAAAQNSLANVFQTLGGRTDGPPGSALLSRAVTAYQEALQVCTRTDHPLEWAMTKQNLANTYRKQSERTAGEAGTALLSLAVAAYQEALQVRTRADHPLDWAATMQNLAAAIARQGERTPGEEGVALLSCAVLTFEDALQLVTRADHPVRWASATQNLANALRTQGERTAGEAGTALLSRAVAACQNALQVATRADHPVDWARTTQNLAIAFATQGARTVGRAGTAYLSRAVAAFEDALVVQTRADHPVDWAMTQENLAICHEAWARHPASEDPAAHLRQALDHVQAALTVYDPDHMPYYHEKATRLRDRLLAAQAEQK